jgi:hypothetical protein
LFGWKVRLPLLTVGSPVDGWLMEAVDDHHALVGTVVLRHPRRLHTTHGRTRGQRTARFARARLL